MFKELYKQNAQSQEQLQDARRRTLLEEQKRKRLELQDEHRSLEPTKAPSKRHVRGTRMFNEAYRSDISLQLSEWLQERPVEMSDWFLVPCPRGQRCLVVASGKRSEMYCKAGRRCFTFRSLLPGDGVARKCTTMLDCIYSQEKNAFYVLDVLAYGSQLLIDCEAQFRFFWLRSKFEEQEELSLRSSHNEKPFHLVERYDFENAEHISVAIQRFPVWPNNEPKLDGFLFYHKQASYTSGTTPLVCWLFPFMVSDVLGLPVSSAYISPSSYRNPLQYMAEFDATLAQKKRQRCLRPADVGMPEVAEESSHNLLAAERMLEVEEDSIEMPLSKPDCH